MYVATQTASASAAEQTPKSHQDNVQAIVYCRLSQASANPMMRTGIPCSGSDLRNSAQICIDDWGSATSYPDEVIDFHPARSLSVTSSFALHGQSMDVVVVFIAPGLTARRR
jgi:hypothetical protein